MKKKDEKKIEKEKIRKALEDMIEKRLEKQKEYLATPTKEHVLKVLEKHELTDNSAVCLISFNPDTLEIKFNGIKAKTSDMVAMLHYALAKVTQYDLSGVMDCVSTVSRQAELNDCWTEHNEKPEEIKDDDDTDSKAE